MAGSSIMTELCVPLPIAFGDVLNANNPEVMGYTDGTLDLSQSAPFANSMNIEVRSGVTARSRKVYFRQRPLASNTDDDPTTACEATPEDDTRNSFDVDLSDYIRSEVSRIYEQDIIQYCDGDRGPQAFVRDRLMPLITQARHGLNRELLTWLQANAIGVNNYHLVSNAPSAAAKPVDLLDVDGNPLSIGITTVRRNFANHQLRGPIGMVGQGNMMIWADQKQLACCNNGGVDLSKLPMGNMLLFEDLAADGILGDNNFLVVAPGTFKLMTFNKYNGPFVKIGESFSHMSIPDPVHPGLVWDLDIKYEDCGPDAHYKVWVSIYWGAVAWPATAFQTGDELENVTGVFLFEGVQQA